MNKNSLKVCVVWQLSIYINSYSYINSDLCTLSDIFPVKFLF